MSDRPTIKKITQIDDATAEDECIYYLSYNEDMTQINLSIKAQRPVTPEEYMDALQCFINDTHEFPENLFVEDGGDEALH